MSSWAFRRHTRSSRSAPDKYWPASQDSWTPDCCIPGVSHVFPLERVADGHRQVETSRTVGKVGIAVRPRERVGYDARPFASGMSHGHHAIPGSRGPVRRARATHGRRAHGAGVRRAPRRRSRAADHPEVLRRASVSQRAGARRLPRSACSAPPSKAMAAQA